MAEMMGGYARLDAAMKEAKAKADALKVAQGQQEIENDFKRQQLEFEREKLNRSSPAGMGMTPGRKSADMAFGKEYQDWASGGMAQSQKGLDALTAARGTLALDDSITGPAAGALPDWARAFTNPQAVNTKETIRGAVQNSLKATLGAQFTEKEGERIFNFAYNDRLPAAQNIERIDRLIKELQAMQASKQDMSEYFEKAGTLTGWKGRAPSSSTLGQEAPPPGSQVPVVPGGAAPKPKITRNPDGSISVD